MRKEVFVFGIAVILAISLLSFVIAQEAGKTALASGQQAVGNAGAGITQKTDQILENDIQIPTGLKTIVKVVFGLSPDVSLSLEEGVVLVVLWIIVLLIVANLVGLIPFLSGGGLVKWAVSIIIMLLVSLSGGFYQAVLWILGLVNMFDFASKNQMIGLLLAITILGVIGWGAMKLLKRMKREGDVSKAEQTGREVGVGNLSRKR